MHPGVFRLTAAPESPLQALVGCTLWAGEGAAASHRSALSLWGEEVSADFFEVSTTHRRDSREGYRVHQVKCLSPEQVTRERGVPVTTPLRTLMDVSSLANDDELDALLARFLSRALVQFGQLTSLFQDRRLKGMRGRALLHSAMRRRRREEPSSTEELAAWVAPFVPDPASLPPLSKSPQVIAEERKLNAALEAISAEEETTQAPPSDECGPSPALSHASVLDAPPSSPLTELSRITDPMPPPALIVPPPLQDEDLDRTTRHVCSVDIAVVSASLVQSSPDAPPDSSASLVLHSTELDPSELQSSADVTTDASALMLPTKVELDPSELQSPAEELAADASTSHAVPSEDARVLPTISPGKLAADVPPLTGQSNPRLFPWERRLPKRKARRLCTGLLTVRPGPVNLRPELPSAGAPSGPSWRHGPLRVEVPYPSRQLIVEVVNGRSASHDIYKPKPADGWRRLTLSWKSLARNQKTCRAAIRVALDEPHHAGELTTVVENYADWWTEWAHLRNERRGLGRRPREVASAPSEGSGLDDRPRRDRAYWLSGWR